MQSKRWLSAFAAFAATATVVMALSGAGAAATGPDLSSSQSIDAYLSSIGVSPASVARQSGALNYAGPNCPGKGWSCTSDTRVVQIAAAGGQNRVECTGETFTEGGQTCVVVQSGDDNSARCIERSTDGGQVQSCSITQTGARNDARIDQTVDQNDGSTQTVTQSAVLTQTSSGSFNRATISQSVRQDTHEGTDQTQTADQAIESSQTATGGAVNKLEIDQSQDQTAHGGSTQEQNSDAATLPDCFPFSPADSPHTCANVSQSSDAGDNAVHLRQVVKQDAKTDAVALQQQGNFGGGLDARVHQDTATGRQRNDVNQDKRQHANGGPGSTQTQVDPVFCCGVGSQAGGSDNKESIDQASSQDASNPLAFQLSELMGQSLTPNGSCDIKQHASNNSDSTTNSASLTPCPFLLLATQCTGVGEEQEGGCVAFDPITEPPGCEFSCDVIPQLVLGRPSQG